MRGRQEGIGSMKVKVLDSGLWIRSYSHSLDWAGQRVQHQGLVRLSNGGFKVSSY